MRHVAAANIEQPGDRSRIAEHRRRIGILGQAIGQLDAKAASSGRAIIVRTTRWSVALPRTWLTNSRSIFSSLTASRLRSVKVPIPPGDVVMRELGFNVDNVVKQAKALL